MIKEARVIYPETYFSDFEIKHFPSVETTYFIYIQKGGINIEYQPKCLVYEPPNKFYFIMKSYNSPKDISIIIVSGTFEDNYLFNVDSEIEDNDRTFNKRFLLPELPKWKSKILFNEDNKLKVFNIKSVNLSEGKFPLLKLTNYDCYDDIKIFFRQQGFDL